MVEKRMAIVCFTPQGKQLAEKSGVSRVTITSVKSGKRCSEETAQKLVAVLGPDIIEEVVT